MIRVLAVVFCLLGARIPADSTEDRPGKYYSLPDGTRLKLGVHTRPSVKRPDWIDYVTQLTLCKADDTENLLWEDFFSTRPEGLVLYHPQPQVARRFGAVLCVVFSVDEGPMVDYVRIDTSRTPATTVKVGVVRSLVVSQTPHWAPVTIENEKEFSYLPKGADKVLFHVYDNGHVKRNGMPYGDFAVVNGEHVGIVTEEEPEAKRVWALGSSGHASGNGAGAEATGPLAALAEATGIRRLPGGWPLLATFAACLAGAASWLLFRARQRRNKQGQRTENGG